MNITGTSGITALAASAAGNIVNYNGASTQTVKTPSAAAYITLKINNSAGATLAGAITATTLTIGDVTANTIFDDGGFGVTSTGTLNLNNTSTYRLGSAGAATTFPVFSTINISTGTTVQYQSGVAQAISAAPAYSNLTLINAGTKTLAGTTTVNGNFLLSSGAFSHGGNSMSVKGNFTIASGTTYTKGGTLDFNGTATQNYNDGATQNIGNVVVSGASTNLNIRPALSAMALRIIWRKSNLPGAMP